MSGDNRMIKIIIVLMLIVLGVEGAVKKSPIKTSVIKPIELDENGYILAALDAQARHKNELASLYYEKLYTQTGQKEYLYNSLRMIEPIDEAKFTTLTTSALSKNPEDNTLKRFSIIALIKSGKYSQAVQEATHLSDKTKAPSDYALLADGYLKMANYQGGYNALQKGYDINFDNEMAERMGLIQYVHLGEKKEAIAFLKQHISVHGNSKVIGNRLGSLYADSGALDDAVQIFEETYDLSHDPLVAGEAIKIYVYQQNTLKLNALLEKSGVNDPFLLELYIRDKQYDKAAELAKKLYKQDPNPLYLAQSSVFSYESAKNKQDPKLLNEVVSGLKQVSTEIENPLYLNYLGYLLIDHDLNVSEGMGYVKRALEQQPESPFYLDSLAWGHYKLNECAEALRLIKQVESLMGTDEDEVREHLKAIEKCKTKEKNQL
jgi:tetratricopeptide (TPR) repeat protein